MGIGGEVGRGEEAGDEGCAAETGEPVEGGDALAGDVDREDVLGVENFNGFLVDLLAGA